MNVNQEKILDFVTNSNFTGLENYLRESNSDVTSVVDKDILKVAFQAFFISEPGSIYSTYKTLKTLEEFIFDKNRINKHRNSKDLQDYILLFEDLDNFEKRQKNNGNTANIISSNFGLELEDVKKAFKTLNERNEYRKTYKFLDKKIERDLVWNIRYPEKTSFIRKLLRIPLKQTPQELKSKLDENLLNFIENITKEIQNDPNFLDARGRFILSDAELNNIIYERVSIKCKKQLRLDQASIDEVFEKINKKQLLNLNVEYKSTQEALEAVKNFGEALAKTKPIYAVNFKDQKVRPANYTNETSAELTKQIRQYFKDVQKEIDFYQNRPGHEELVIKLIDSLLPNNSEISKNTYQNIKKAVLDEEIVKTLKATKLEAQKIIYDRLEESHFSKTPTKKSLTEFEKQAFRLIQLNGKIEYTNEDKRLLSTFFEYATSNTDLNLRLKKLLNKNDDFIQEHQNTINEIYKYTFKTVNLDLISKSVDNLETVLDKYNNKQEITKKEKVTLSQIGRLTRFLKASEQFKLLEELELGNHSGEIEDLLNLRKRCTLLTDKLGGLIKNQRNFKAGDIAAENSSKMRLFGGFKRDLQDLYVELVGKYHHAANIYRGKGFLGKMKFSHINPKYESSDIETYDSMTYDIYRFKPFKLLKDEFKEELKTKLNLDSDKKLEVELERRFEKISSDLTDRIDSSLNMEFDGHRGFIAMASDYIPNGHKQKTNLRDWANGVLSSAQRDSKIKVTDNIEGNIICSELSAKMMVLAFVKLETDLRKFLGEEFAVDVLELPLGKNECLSKIYPTRLIKELRKRDAIELQPAPDVIEQIIR